MVSVSVSSLSFVILFIWVLSLLFLISHWELWLLPLCGWYWLLLPCLLIPNHLYTSQLCWSVGGMKLKWVLVQCPQRPRKLVSYPFLPFPLGELFLAGEFPLGTEQCQPGGWSDAGKMKLFFLQFLCSYAKAFCSTVLQKFIKWDPELSQSWSCL